MKICSVQLSSIIVFLAFISCNKYNSNVSDIYTNLQPDNNIGSLGKVYFNYNDKKTLYTIVRAKDGNVWLQQNLGANQIANSSADSLSYGDYFQWGRWDDGHQLQYPQPEVRNPDILLQNNPSGLPLGGINIYIAAWWNTGTNIDRWEAHSPSEVNKFNGCDPCKAIGNNWRLPTIEEWSRVLEAENIVDTQSAFQSNLKISCAGWRSSKNTFLKETKTAARFWSSTASATNAAFSVLITDSGLIKDFSDSRSYGMSIRCIQKM